VIATPTGSGTLKAGDLIKFSNHDKIYMLTADVTLSNGSAETLNIFPALISGVTNANDVLTEDISIKVRLTNDVQTFSTGVDDVFEYEIDVRESL